jgi:hypothetical protein
MKNNDKSRSVITKATSWGEFSTEHPPRKIKARYRFIGLLAMLIGAFLFAFAYSEKVTFMYVLAVPCISFGAILLFKAPKQIDNDYAEFLKEAKKDAPSEKSNTSEAVSEKSNEQEVDEDVAEYEALTKYTKYYGSEKSIKICEAAIKKCEEQVAYYKKMSKDADDFGFEYINAMSVKEKDWATHGGIASGIAGVGAGISVAADIQRRNAEIREHNASVEKSTIKTTAQLQALILNNQRAAQKELDE